MRSRTLKGFFHRVCVFLLFYARMWTLVIMFSVPFKFHITQEFLHSIHSSFFLPRKEMSLGIQNSDILKSLLK